MTNLVGGKMNTIPHYYASTHQYAIPAHQYNTPNNPHFPPSFQNTHTQQFSVPASPGELTANATQLSLEGRRLCPECKGKKYGFTSYLHNKRIFPTPPHLLLPLIEASYTPKNRLKSLLLNYTSRPIDSNRLHDIDAEITSLGQQVTEVVERVQGVGFSGKEVLDAVSAVQSQTLRIMNRLVGHVYGFSRIGKEEAREFMRDFKRAWEELWRSCMREENDRQNRGQM